MPHICQCNLDTWNLDFGCYLRACLDILSCSLQAFTANLEGQWTHLFHKITTLLQWTKPNLSSDYSSDNTWKYLSSQSLTILHGSIVVMIVLKEHFFVCLHFRWERASPEGGWRHDAVQWFGGLHVNLLHSHAPSGHQHAQLSLHPVWQLLWLARHLQGTYYSYFKIIVKKS